MIRPVLAIGGLTLTLLLGGCPSNMISNPDTLVFPDSAVSYSQHVQPFFTLRCFPCHDSYNASGDIKLTDYSSVMFSRANMVVPGNPDQSLLMLVLTGSIQHISGQINEIPAHQIYGIRTWIQEGALPN